jgi:hypothetical protein
MPAMDAGDGRLWRMSFADAGDDRRAEPIAEIFSSILCHRADCPMIEAISSLISVILFESDDVH